MVLDLAEVVFVDSTGLKAITHLAATAKQFRLARPSRAVRRLLEVTGFGPIFRIEDAWPEEV